MIRLSCCIPGGSLMPEGVASVPKSPAVQIIEKCRYLLSIGYDNTECGGGMLANLTEEEVSCLIRENQKKSLGLIAVNSLFPGEWRLADPELDKSTYIARAVKIFDIMQALGIPYAVFGSGGARSLRDDCVESSRASLIEFMKTIAAEAGKRGIVLLIEPLRQRETNIFITVAEAGEAIKEIADPNILLLYDAFHMAEERTSLECVREYAPLLRHCHMAESPHRTYPGSSDSADLQYNRHFAKELLASGYDGAVSVECGFRDFKKDAAEALHYLKEIFMDTAVFEYKAIRTVKEEPVFLQPMEGRVYADITSVVCGDRRFPASPMADGVIAILSAESGEVLTLTADNAPLANGAEVILHTDESRAEVKIQGNTFANYNWTTDIPKPFFGPVVDNAGNTFTRPDIHHNEHPHQRSVFIAVGDVNGVDCWNERGNYGYVRNEAIDEIYSGAAYASFKAHNKWTDLEFKPLLTETTRYTVYNQSEDCRALDIETIFRADYGDVEFGATKEAGPLGIRLRDELRADIGSGQLSNSWGAIGEGEAWGKTAEWCDYAGIVDEIGTMGVTVFDDERNERHPTSWHIRGYGLFAANNLYFKGGFTIKEGESVTYRYRILFRRVAMTKDEIADRYVVYTLGKKY